jgi:hypothetical protein
VVILGGVVVITLGKALRGRPRASAATGERVP